MGQVSNLQLSLLIGYWSNDRWNVMKRTVADEVPRATRHEQRVCQQRKHAVLIKGMRIDCHARASVQVTCSPPDQ